MNGFPVFSMPYDGRFGFADVATQARRDGGLQFLFRFPNGHTASIIRTNYSMMSELNWYEGTVMNEQEPNTLRQFLTSPSALSDEADVTRFLKLVSELPPVSMCTSELYENVY
ncbi:MAG: hypothetical protein IJ215_00065 [Clostridia bacterium]|nr:hypothetical protein [Clostridia bacterium]